MKKVINRNLRWGLLGLLLLLILSLIGPCVWWLKQPMEIVKEKPNYTCQQQIYVDYQVYVAPNDFFTEGLIGPDQAYITSLTQSLETALNYKFSADAVTDISGEYQVEAALTGYILQETSDGKEIKKEKIKVWSKPYTLLPPVPFLAQERKLEEKLIIPIDIRAYATFAEQLVREVKFAADLVELTVTYLVETKASTPGGEISEPLKAVLLIPIKGNSFIVQGVLTDKNEKSLMHSVTEVVQGVKTARIAYAVGAGLCFILFLLVLFKTTEGIEEPEETMLRRIIKKHGERIVDGFNWVPALSEKNMLTLSSFDDLVKVADEVEQPILYRVADSVEHSFYVVHEPLIYHYCLKISGAKNSMLKNALERSIPSKTDALET